MGGWVGEADRGSGDEGAALAVVVETIKCASFCVHGWEGGGKREGGGRRECELERSRDCG